MKKGQKGIVLFIVLATIMVVIILANVMLSIISSQSRLTHHQVSRIQAYYAAKAGTVYALEMLRTNAWTAPRTIALCPAAAGCIPAIPLAADNVTNSGLVYPVEITIIPQGAAGCTGGTVPAGIDACVNATVDYHYTP